MRRPRWRKVIADLWSNRTRSLLVVASIAVGLFALGVMATIYFVAMQDMQRGYAAANPANIFIQSTYFSQGLVDSLDDVEGVRQAEGVRQLSTRLEAEPDKWISIDIEAMKDPGEKQINQLTLVEGVWPPGDGEIVIDRYKLEETNAALGDTVALETPSGNTRQLTVVGVVQDQTIGSFSGSGGFLMPLRKASSTWIPWNR